MMAVPRVEVCIMSQKTHSSIVHRLSLGLGCVVVIVTPHLSVATESAVGIPMDTQVGRYSVMAAQPAPGQQNLLAVTRTIRMPKDVHSVGEAVRWVLQPSGYRLAGEEQLSAEVRAMLTLPLPAAHRHFDALPLHTVLELIAGPAFHLVEDPVHRLIAFERCVGIARTNTGGES